MSKTVRHGINAAIYADTSVGGTAAVGTATLTLLTAKGSWSIDQTRDLVETTSFGDASKNRVAGLQDGQGTIGGFKDFADNAIWAALSASAERGLIIIPDAANNPGTFYSGKAFFSPKYAGSTTTAVTEDITFTAGPSAMAWTHP